MYKNIVFRKYPLVLAEDQLQHSFCMWSSDQEKKLMAHLNLWPRTLRSQDGKISYPIALLGNVVTHPDYQGQGLMSKILSHIWSILQRRKVLGLVLWSDLEISIRKMVIVSLVMSID